ncbi:sensor histidine kinase [Clostridioides difficile]
MYKLNVFLIVVSSISIIVSICIVIINNYSIRKTMNKLDNMIDLAIDGRFTETMYDESVLSSVESKMNNYLCSSSISSQNIELEKNKVKSLISDISHQTKTPISNILLYSEILSENNELTETSKKSVQQICNQAENLNFLISSLINASRLETNIINIIKTKNSVNELIDKVVKQLRPKSEIKNIKIKIDKNIESNKASFDMKWTIEALHNIIENAIKYTHQNGYIQITTVPYEFFFRIDISDNGIGIEEYEINDIFKRFYRSKGVSQYEGVGIGLFLTREIIYAQGGYIKVISVVGEGTVFSVFLPIEN